MEVETLDSKEQHDSEEQTEGHSVRFEVEIIQAAFFSIFYKHIFVLHTAHQVPRDAFHFFYSNQYQSYQPYQHYQQRYNQEVNQGAPTSADATLLRTSSDIHNKPQETKAANNQRSNYDHTQTPNRGRGRRIFGRGSRNNYPVRNQDGSDIDRETITFLAADQTIQAMFKPYLLEGTVNGEKMIFLRDSGATRSFLRSDLVESKDINIDK